MDADIAEVREKYLNLDFDQNDFYVDPEKTVGICPTLRRDR